MVNKTSQPLFDWFAPISSLKGVGSKIAEKLSKLNIETMGDLLLHCPYRYENRTELTPIAKVTPEQFVLVQGHVLQIKLEGKRKKRAIVTISDQTGVLTLLFFHFHSSMQSRYVEGALLRCFGQIKATMKGYQIIHPECEFIKENDPLPTHLTPLYPTVAGLSQGWLRRTIGNLLKTYTQYQNQTDQFANTLSSHLPMHSWVEALKTIHQPQPSDNIDALILRKHPAYNRLICEELVSHHISLARIKAHAKSRQSFAVTVDDKFLDDFLKTLPFQLTHAQNRVWSEIRQDMAQDKPMLRLVQGDVGSGKTIVAALSMLGVIAQHKQVAIMAPTEILAEQHLKHFSEWFAPFGFRCELLKCKLKAKPKRSVLENITLGLTHVVIGTHALFQDDVQFKELGLIVIDEQHRFGVHQRLALHVKGNTALNPCYPHQLIMTATPIPRTLAMSHYAHLDISVIDALPPGRKPITTLTVPQKRRDEIIERMKSVCASGQQVYWVCTLIEESETLQCQAAEVTATALQEHLPKVGLVHGRMDALEKESVMQAFYKGDISVLVATTVIEVGVNVPNATLMVIENPERLGLAQLHQLRGRVGRGSDASFCVLLYQAPLSQMAQSRLRIMRETTDGFVIAEADLELRGPGEVLGVRQTGSLAFKIADLQRDKEMFESLEQWSQLLTTLTAPHIERMIQRWGVGTHFSQA